MMVLITATVQLHEIFGGEMGREAQVLQGSSSVGQALEELSAAPEPVLIDEHEQKERSSSSRSWTY